jgi:hypothetical protein
VWAWTVATSRACLMPWLQWRQRGEREEWQEDSNSWDSSLLGEMQLLYLRGEEKFFFGGHEKRVYWKTLE